jgi:hypothetical protein
MVPMKPAHDQRDLLASKLCMLTGVHPHCCVRQRPTRESSQRVRLFTRQLVSLRGSFRLSPPSLSSRAGPRPRDRRSVERLGLQAPARTVRSAS